MDSRVCPTYCYSSYLEGRSERRSTKVEANDQEIVTIRIVGTQHRFSRPRSSQSFLLRLGLSVISLCLLLGLSNPWSLSPAWQGYGRASKLGWYRLRLFLVNNCFLGVLCKVPASTQQPDRLRMLFVKIPDRRREPIQILVDSSSGLPDDN